MSGFDGNGTFPDVMGVNESFSTGNLTFVVEPEKIEIEGPMNIDRRHFPCSFGFVRPHFGSFFSNSAISSEDPQFSQFRLF